VRAFLAVPVVPPARSELDIVRSRLRGDLSDVRWAPAETAHITLHFFGSITGAAAAVAVAALRPVVAAAHPFTLQLDGLGAFPSGTRPSVLWCGVGGDVAALHDLTRDVVATLRSTGHAVDTRPQLPHCTLGRPRQPWPRDCSRRWAELVAATGTVTPPFPVDHAVLYESVSDRSGVHHLARETLALG
jgi:2'-5' RNA ligase